MAKRKEGQIETLVAAGVIGAALGALVSKNKAVGTLLGGIAGAAIAASLEAFEDAQKANMPILVEENDVLYKISADGKKRKIKDLPHSTTVLKKRFILK